MRRPVARRYWCAAFVALLAAASLAGCGTRSAVQGGAGDRGGHARVKVGIPF